MMVQSSAASELIADLNKEIATAHSERDELRARISELEAQLAESMKVESAGMASCEYHRTCFHLVG